MKIRAIAFDLDGVLIDSTPCHAEAFRRVLEGFGIQDFVYARYAGQRTLDVLRAILSGRPVAEEDVLAAAAEKSRLARELVESTQPLAPDCVRVIRELSRHYALALASSGSRASVDAFLRLTGTGDLFRSVLTGDDVARAKPDPELYTRTGDRLGIQADEMLVVEDAISGIEAARRSGAVVVGVAGTHPVEELQAAGAAYTVTSLPGLLVCPALPLANGLSPS